MNPDRGHGRAGRVRAALRTLAVAVVAGLIATSLLRAGELIGSSVTSQGFVMFGATGLAVLVLRLAGRRMSMSRAATRAARIVELVAVNLLLTVLALEAVTQLTARLWPSPLVWNEQGPAAAIEAHRLQPGRLLHGRPVNSKGFHDEEFFAAGPNDLVVACVADSFGVGLVPLAYNFTTVAERIVRQARADSPGRVAVHNISMSAIGPAEYVQLIRSEALPLEPATVVVCLFVGNDILHGNVHPLRWNGYALQDWLFWKAGSRILTALTVRGALEKSSDATFDTAMPNPASGRDAELRELELPMPDVADEVPRYDPATYDEIQLRRMAVTDASNRRTERGYRRLFESLDYLRSQLGDRLLVFVIPDEFQVNDEQWRRLSARGESERQFDRDLPQRRILEYCAKHGVDVVDALPALRASVRAGGDRPYHLRDTHWNALGNRIGGEVLGAALQRRIDGR